MILGHEGAGIVESVGEGVTKLKAGKEARKPLCDGLAVFMSRDITTIQLFMSSLPILEEQVFLTSVKI